MEKTDIKKGNIIQLTITDIAFGGKGISKINTPNGLYVIFVYNTIPGQIVNARIVKKKHSYAEAKVTEVVKKSKDEYEHPFQPIPGAPFATWPIEKQQLNKKKSTLELLKRIGNIQQAELFFDEFIGSPNHWHYRNKMEYSFSSIVWDEKLKTDIDGFGLGFKHRGQWRVVENINSDSGLFDPQIENNLPKIRKWCIESKLPAWHPVRHHGFYRYLTVRKSFYSNKVLFKLSTSSSHLSHFNSQKFVQLLQNIMGSRLAGVIHTVNDGQGDRTQDEHLQGEILFGEDRLVEKIHNLYFDVSMESFFQPNPKSAELLYQKAIDYTFLNQKMQQSDTIIDLFCGTGTIGQLVANQTKGKIKVIGVDIIKKAIEDAQKNAQKNHLKNLEFYAEDVKNFLLQHPEYKGNIQTIILDPPRSGITPKALRRIIELNAQRIVYISCNPATQARDLVAFTHSGYTVQKISIIDQFVHTAHVESIILLDRIPYSQNTSLLK